MPLSIIELLIVLSLVSSILPIFSKISGFHVEKKLSLYETFAIIQVSKQLAISNDTDCEIIIENKNINISLNQRVSTHHLTDPKTTILSNRHKLGFKPNSHTKYSGTISLLKNNNPSGKISIGVGNGEIRIK
ncbi:hypothetical protein HOH45_07110 [bacterium]|jgi:hypothetical protein|nr:hypothetical protein [bacterium]